MIRVFPLTGVPKVSVGGYGPRPKKDGTMGLHDAVDLGAPTSTPVVAVDDGTVTYGTDPLGGNVAILKTASGPDAYYYAHLEDAQTGSRTVKTGASIARCDTTGNAALVGIPHVHFQWWSSGTFAGPHPDPTTDLWAAPVLAAPVGASSSRWSTWALVAAAVASAAGVAALAVEEWRHPGILLPWRAA